MREALHNAQTGITALFVRRPVLAFVFNTLIAVAGLAALFGIEVRELPDVDRPVITVSTNFSGAAAETMDREVTAIIEGAVARVPGVQAISSDSYYGRSRVTVEFSDSVNLDTAASDLRDAVSRIQNSLPDDADAPRIIKADNDAQAVMRIALTSTTMPIQDMTTLVEDEVVDVLSAVPGVADVQVYGDRTEIFRIDINQTRLSSLGLTVADVSRALGTVAFDTPAGSLSNTTQNLTVRATAAISTPGQFEAIYLKDHVRLGDVATVTLGGDIGESQLRANGRTGIGIGIVRQAQSNTLEISSGVRAAVEQLSTTLPDGVDIEVTSDDATFINGAIHEVEIALVIAVTVVLLVIFLFLRDFRATLIPGLAIPVALIGTLATIYLAGFSINILTLLALVLATGLVVDDAIVVLENIVRRRNEGMGARAAAVLGTQEVFFAVLATTATLIAVFVPISFLPGQAGGLFKEFGFVLAMAVFLSSLVALSLCPMLASRMLIAHPEGEAREDTGVIARVGGAMTTLYRKLLRFCLDAPALILLISVLFAGASYGAFGFIKSEITPSEDRSMAFMRVSAPQGVSLDYFAERLRRIEALIEPLRDSGEIVSTFSIAGQGAGNSGFLVLRLAPWDERDRSQQEIVADISERVRNEPGVRAFVFQPNSLGIRGAGNGLSFAVAGNNFTKLSATAASIVEAMGEDPSFRQARLSSDSTQPQLSIAIDRDRAFDLGIDIDGLGNTIQAMLDGRRIGSVFINDRSVDVKLVSTTNPVDDPTDLENTYVKAGDGRFVPLSVIARLEEQAVPPSLSRENQLRAVGVSASLAPGVALGEAYQRAQEIAEPLLEPGMRLVPLGEAAALGETANSMQIIFGFALVIILLVLAAQFESFISALIIMATVPLGLACAVFAMLLTGTSLNVYSQIGLVLLVGIMAKNGILIVEFANQLRDRGLGVREAIEQASLIRLRPVAMTMICTIVGGVPLVMASGAGAEARIALGWVMVGGLGLATVSTLFLTPVAYLLLGRFITPKAEEEARLVRELDHATRLGDKTT
ncbi:efflux RND transporter permease subunit [Nitratireductor aquimarinus]|uniref:efflux RND transporter permease subunit n=1 Tax=Nitratireductor aquimarinus TaxID=889300 RepID=UPI001A8D03FA|nr:efflux RND transporter permease subunit [Nitratireductor aquimarinus]MBN8243959.1 efflux RND transporter permease subunit [Nitratireductor aquimarinus]MBY6131493.1 efflux RND transporter permease subunit [Nitratireductor aquimarinus]MCA1301028.1 efflux RND transporter permease subunit [Nitratireductor aquimarinus]